MEHKELFLEAEFNERMNYFKVKSNAGNYQLTEDYKFLGYRTDGLEGDNMAILVTVMVKEFNHTKDSDFISIQRGQGTLKDITKFTFVIDWCELCLNPEGVSEVEKIFIEFKKKYKAIKPIEEIDEENPFADWTPTIV